MVLWILDGRTTAIQPAVMFHGFAQFMIIRTLELDCRNQGEWEYVYR